MEPNITDAKKSARSAASKIRAAAHDVEKDRAPLALAARMFPLEATRNRNIVSGFYPYKSEIDVRPLLGVLAGHGWTTALPVVIALGQPLEFRRWLPGEPTMAGAWDIPRPLEDAPLVEPHVLLVPMMAFDRQGYRLGYGGGFYDRTLAKYRTQRKVTAIGVAYAAQEVDHVPHVAEDQRIDYVMTEKELFACG